MVPHRVDRRFTVLESLFNRRLRTGRCVEENAFGVLKQTWQELLTKLDLHIVFIPDVMNACCILHNIMLGQNAEEVAFLLAVLGEEGLNGVVLDAEDKDTLDFEDVVQDQPLNTVEEKRLMIGVYLAGVRHLGR